MVLAEPPSFSEGPAIMTKDLERTVRRERDARTAKEKKMQEFERGRADTRGSRLSHNLKIEKQELQKTEKAKRAFSR